MAEVFLTAFHALSRTEQNRVMVGMVRDRRLREDLIDLAIAEARAHEPSRSFRQFLSTIKKPLKRAA